MAIYIGRAYAVNPITGLTDSAPKYVKFSYNERRLQAELSHMAGVQKIEIGVIVNGSFQGRIATEGLV